jgi:hypothetical protein
MTTYPRSPRILKGGLVLIDPETSAVRRMVVLQYNPDSISRTLQAQAAGGEGKDRVQALRLTGPPIETIKLDAEIDVTDQLELPDQGQNRVAAELGLHPQLAALETIVYPSSRQVLDANRLAQSGTLEIAPMEAPLTLFVWSKTRILPVRLTDFSVTEEAFDPNLNPIRAKVSLGMRVLNVNDLGFAHKGGSLFMTYFQQKEKLAAMAQAGGFGALGVSGIP